MPPSALRRPAALTLALCACAVALGGAPARADEGGDRVEVRESRSCGSSGAIRLRLRAEDGEIRIDTDIRTARTGVWRLTVLHERRIVARARIRATRASGGLRHRVVTADYAGADAVSARAVSPGGGTCTIAALLPSARS